jgi:hypothetical protein
MNVIEVERMAVISAVDHSLGRDACFSVMGGTPSVSPPCTVEDVTIDGVETEKCGLATTNEGRTKKIKNSNTCRKSDKPRSKRNSSSAKTRARACKVSSFPKL